MMSKIASNFMRGIDDIFVAKTKEEEIATLASIDWASIRKNCLRIAHEYLHEPDSWIGQGHGSKNLAKMVYKQLEGWQKDYGKELVPDAAIADIIQALQSTSSEDASTRSALSKKRASNFYLVTWWLSQINGFSTAEDAYNKIDTLLDLPAFQAKRAGGSNRLSAIYLAEIQAVLKNKLLEAKVCCEDIGPKVARQKSFIAKQFTAAMQDGLATIFYEKMPYILPAVDNLHAEYTKFVQQRKALQNSLADSKNQLHRFQQELENLVQEKTALINPILIRDPVKARAYEIAPQKIILKRIPTKILPETLNRMDLDRYMKLASLYYQCYPALKRHDYEAFYHSKQLPVGQELELSLVKVWVASLLADKEQLIHQKKMELAKIKAQIDQLNSQRIQTEREEKACVDNMQKALEGVDDDKKIFAYVGLKPLQVKDRIFTSHDLAKVIDEVAPESVASILQKACNFCYFKDPDKTFAALHNLFAEIKASLNGMPDGDAFPSSSLVMAPYYETSAKSRPNMSTENVA
ncbi:MAG: hypothetical protein Q7V63_09470 [Gammaproteobacteria bacterium]|nr:hypothetical protein [Gammaproteobacteria bacterium]